jgi:hypothetical protein
VGLLILKGIWAFRGVNGSRSALLDQRESARLPSSGGAEILMEKNLTNDLEEGQFFHGIVFAISRPKHGAAQYSPCSDEGIA